MGAPVRLSVAADCAKCCRDKWAQLNFADSSCYGKRHTVDIVLFTQKPTLLLPQKNQHRCSTFFRSILQTLDVASPLHPHLHHLLEATAIPLVHLDTLRYVFLGIDYLVFLLLLVVDAPSVFCCIFLQCCLDKQKQNKRDSTCPPPLCGAINQSNSDYNKCCTQLKNPGNDPTCPQPTPSVVFVPVTTTTTVPAPPPAIIKFGTFLLDLYALPTCL